MWLLQLVLTNSCFPYEFDFVGNNVADWHDENIRIVCDIFADEVLKGN
jgi:hypothetical protein